MNQTSYKTLKKKKKEEAELTMEEREQMVSEKARSLRAAMAIINTNISSRRRSEHLSLVLKQGVSLNHSN
jgi:hypothetical protein